MIAEIGHFALIAAFLLAGLQATVPLYGAHKGDRGMMNWRAQQRLASSPLCCWLSLHW